MSPSSSEPSFGVTDTSTNDPVAVAARLDRPHGALATGDLAGEGMTGENAFDQALSAQFAIVRHAPITLPGT
ncbi:hypothetical protein, partial [Amycolatopsis sp. NPDC004079]|uniref:hypothetical protein n=1 Tax=Amycolatopsis sp. NPDC004079 TaxID=3154549 RepID=UPI0033A38E72